MICRLGQSTTKQNWDSAWTDMSPSSSFIGVLATMTSLFGSTSDPLSIAAFTDQVVEMKHRDYEMGKDPERLAKLLGTCRFLAPSSVRDHEFR
jgi:hypothetical protein